VAAVSDVEKETLSWRYPLANPNSKTTAGLGWIPTRRSNWIASESPTQPFMPRRRLTDEIVHLFPRLKFPQSGPQPDAQCQNPAGRQPGHGVIVAYVIGGDSCDAAGGRVDETDRTKPGV